MYSGNNISVLGWMLLLLILTVPILNVVFIVWKLLKRKANKTVKNFFIAFGVFYLLAWFGMFNGVFANITQLFG